MSRKQEIYLKIFGMVLPLLRNMQRQPLWHRVKSSGFFLEAELVHNLPECLVQAEFTKRDVWWINAQARLYVEQGNETKCAFYTEFVTLIAELFCLVPEDLKADLTWSGPKSSKNTVK